MTIAPIQKDRGDERSASATLATSTPYQRSHAAPTDERPTLVYDDIRRHRHSSRLHGGDPLSNDAINWAFGLDVRRSADKLVLLALADAANEHWACFPGKEEIAGKASCAPSSIVHCTRRLEEAGHLVRIPFEALKGQDQKIGYVLAGGGRIHDLDDEFLAIAFAARKLPGRPLAEKPKHWDGRRRSDAASMEFGQGDQPVTLPGEGDYPVTPRGDQPVTPRTLSRPPTTSKDSDAADAASFVDADASTICAADASRAARDDQTRAAKPKRRQSLAAYLKTLGSDAINEIYWDFDTTKSDLLKNYAAPRARDDLKVPAGKWPDELDEELTLKSVEIVIHTLRKRSYSEFGEIAEGYLDGFEWPPEKNAPQATGDAAEGELRYRHSPGFLYAGAGHADACAASIHAAIDRMSAVELSESLTLFTRHRPDVLDACRGVAAKTATLHADHGQERQTLHAAVEHYLDWHRDKPQTKWPKFVVPAEMHPKQEPAAAAA